MLAGRCQESSRFASEAVICESERGVDYDFCPNPTGPRAGVATATPDDCQFNNEVSNCTSEQVGYSDSRPFMAGTYIWSGWDYGSGDRVVSDRGGDDNSLVRMGLVAGVLCP